MSDAVQGELVKRDPKVVEMVGKAGTASLTGEMARNMSFDDLAALFGAVPATEAIGTDQFGPILEDKARLVGVPFFLVHWQFHDGDFGSFVSLWVLTQDNQRYIVNDGSTGIADQLRTLTGDQGITAGVMCQHGLRVSEYDYTDDNGKVSRAKTFYIDTKL